MRSVKLAMTATAMAGALTIGLLGSTGEAEARKATRQERAAMLKALRANSDGFAQEPRRCWNTFVTRVARARPRTGAVWMNVRLRERRNCSLGDGYVIMRRPTRTSQRWRVVWEGSEGPPCRLINNRMSREMGLKAGPCRRQT